MAGRTLRTLILGMAILSPIALLVAPTQIAEATTIAPLTVEQLTDASEYIVRGEVQEVWTELDDRGYVWTRARVKVSETFKGVDEPDELVVSSLGGTYGGLTLRIEASAQFSQYDESILFLARSGENLTPVGKFLGKYIIRRAPDENRQYVRRWHPTGQTFDARFLPHVEQAERTYLDELVASIEARLDTGWDGKPIPGVSPERLTEVNTIERRKR